MPTYVYKREDGTTFEVMQRITADPLEVCPDTGQKVKRVIGVGGGLIFKGEGFYVTDYVRKKKSAAESGDVVGSTSNGGSEETASKPQSKTQSKTESKPEAKAKQKAGTKASEG